MKDILLEKVYKVDEEIRELCREFIDYVSGVGPLEFEPPINLLSEGDDVIYVSEVRPDGRGGLNIVQHNREELRFMSLSIDAQLELMQTILDDRED